MSIINVTVVVCSELLMFNLENDLMRVSQLEGPITNGPLMRWQRKANESVGAMLGNESISLSCSINASTSINRGSSKTPMKALNQSSNGINKSKTPSHTPGGSKGKTPGKF